MKQRGGRWSWAYSISCTDSEWERVRVLAKRKGLSISRYMVQCGLYVDLRTEPVPPPRLVLDEADQRAVLGHVTAIAERTVSAGAEDAVMIQVRNSLAFLAEETMRTMMREGRGEGLWALLIDLFGEDTATATIERLRARTNADSSDSH